MKMIAAMAVAAAMVAGIAAQAADDSTPDWIMDTSAVGQDHNGVLRSRQLLEIGIGSSGANQLEGENSLRSGDVDAAILNLQKAVEMAPGDMDKRILYAQALQKKLMKQKVKDPKLYNFLVKQWMYVYKHTEYIDQTIEAKQALKDLTGTQPRPLERTVSFLKRVLVPEDSAVALSKRPGLKTE